MVAFASLTILAAKNAKFAKRFWASRRDLPKNDPLSTQK